MLQWMRKTGNRRKKAATMAGLFLVAVFCFYFSFGHSIPTFAQTETTGGAGSITSEDLGLSYAAATGLPSTDIRLIVANIIRIALGLLGIVVLVLIIYAGFLWMTAAGNEEQIEKAKKILKNAVIGLAIILSAYAIVFFVMRMLGIGTGELGGIVSTPGTQNFNGSGALGRVIKDHYPARGQNDVPRNTKIVVTFFHPIKLEGLVTDTNSDGILGNCNIPVNNWGTDCDQLVLNNDYINISQIIAATTTTGTVSYEPISAAALVASPTVDPTTGISGIYTIVMRPVDYLGSEVVDVPYKVHLGNSIKRDDVALGNPGIFSGSSGSKYYEWQFTCGTELDLSPPYVIDVYPGIDTVEYKNTVVQISFNEPMDPIGVQGIFATSSYGYYYLQNGFIFIQNQESTMPIGAFNLVNNYQTLEFTPSVPCGKNACGNTVYCMPVCDAEGADCSQDSYEILLKAASTISPNTFESNPFTGVADICGNALDGNNDGQVDVGPTIEPVFVPTGQGWKLPDHYFWGFSLKDELDLTPPIISQIIPGPEAPWVSANEAWNMWFDKRMRIDPMYYIGIEESPTPQERCAYYELSSEQCILDLIWKVPFVVFTTSTPITRTIMNHGPFLDGLPQGYIPYIDSNVEDAHFNCLYPGQGPLSAEPYGDDKTSGYCDKNPDNCCVVDGVKVFCCNGIPLENQSNPENCRSNLLIPLTSPSI